MGGICSGQGICLGVDVASTHFCKNNRYEIDSGILDSDGMIRTIASWLDRFPIISVEDGLSEEDWDHWPQLRQAIAGKALTMGDDLLCTNPGRIQRAIATGACDALLLKVNQIGTLTEALAAHKQARSAGWSVTLSVRSGETEDNWAADLAVGWQTDQFKNDPFASLSDSQSTTACWKLLRAPTGDSRTGRTVSETRISRRPGYRSCQGSGLADDEVDLRRCRVNDVEQGLPFVSFEGRIPWYALANDPARM